MSHIKLHNVSLSYPIYGADSRSLKRDIIGLTTGGGLVVEEGKITTVEALKNIHLELNDGDRLGLVGHNGAGKSTLLKVISGVFEPCNGNVDIQGRISNLLDLNVGIQENLSGYENIRIRALLMGYDKAQTQDMIANVEAFSELGEYLTVPVKTYSSGMRVRLALAMSTAVHPEILLLDEIIGAGDNRFLKKSKARISEMITQSNILVIASHSFEVIKDFCNKVIYMEHGEIKMLGTPDEVISKYAEELV